MLGEISTVTEDLSFYQNFLNGLKAYENYPEHKIALDRDWKWTLWNSEDVWYKGVLDLLVLKRQHKGVGGLPTEATVFDWKSGKQYPDHDDQKSIYSLAAYSQFPSVLSVRAVHVYLDLGKNTAKTFHRDEMHELRQYWTDRAAKLEGASSFLYNPGWHCRYCAFAKDKGGPCQF